MTDETIIQFGSAIKALGEGKVGGYLVKFTDANTPDLAGEFFDATTDFDIEPGDPTRVYYNHGLDERLKRRKLGKGTLTVDDTGVWVEAQLAMRDEYEQAIYAMVEAGKLGWSSGTLPNLVEYEAVGKAVHIKSWPLGKDASLTPTPAAGLVATQAMPLKAWAEWQVKSIDLNERCRMVADAIDKKYNTLRDVPMASSSPYYWTEYVYEDYAIIRQDAQRWKVTYSIANNAVTLGDPSKVEMDWVAAKGMIAHFGKTKVGTGQPADIAIKAQGAEVAQPEAGRSPAAVTVASAEPKTVTNQEVEMDNETQSAILDALKAQGEAIAGLRKQLENEPAVKSAGVAVKEDEADRALKGNPFKSFGEQLLAVRHSALYGETDKRLLPLKAVLGANEAVPAEGGFLVSTAENRQIDKKMWDSSVFASRATQSTIPQGANSAAYYGRDEDSRANGGRYGGITGYRVAEGATITASGAQKFYQYTLRPKKYAAVAYATDEVIADAFMLEQEIMSAVPEELAFMVDDDMFRGLGVAGAHGVTNHAALITITKETGQAAATIVYQNLLKMWARRYARGRYAWFVNQDCGPQLDQLVQNAGTGGMPPNFIDYGPEGIMRIKGAPVIETEFNATLGTVGDILLADWSQYKLATIGGLQSASSIHVQFLTDQMCYRFTRRVDGLPTWKSALTPYQGSNTQSPFIVLATRA